MSFFLPPDFAYHSNALIGYGEHPGLSSKSLLSEESFRNSPSSLGSLSPVGLVRTSIVGPKSLVFK
ncbi:MAG: hypothetical protein V3U15_05250 [Nitrospinota bacterium]